MLPIGTPATRELLAIQELFTTNSSPSPLWTREPAGLGREMNGVDQNGEKEESTAAEKEPSTTSSEEPVQFLDDHGHHCHSSASGSKRENYVYSRPKPNHNHANPGNIITANRDPAGNGSVTSRPGGIISGLKLAGGPGSSGGGEFQVRLRWLWGTASG